MSITKAHLAWFKLNARTQLTAKPTNKPTLSSTTLPTLTYRSYVLTLMNMQIPQSPVHYKYKGQWYAKPVFGGAAQKLKHERYTEARQEVACSKA